MQVTVEEVGKLTRRLTVTLANEMVEKELEAGYSKLKNEVKLKGYRRGKVPRRVLEQHFGPKIQAEVGEKLVQDTYFDAVEKEKIDPVVHPEITSHKFGDDGSFHYVAEVDIRPEFTLVDFKTIEVEKPETKVSHEEVEAELQRLRRENAPLRNVEDRGVAKDDLAVVDFQGYDDGKKVDQIHGENYTVDVGSGRNGAEFEDQLLGLARNEERNFTIDFPADSPSPIMAGKSIEFRVKVREIKERVLAAVDDEFAKDVGGEQQSFATLGELKAHIRQEKKRAKDEAQEGDLIDRVMKALLDRHEFEVPSRLVQFEIEDHLRQTEETLKRSGLTLESAGINREEAAAHYREAAEKRVRGDFILKKVAEQAEIKLDDEDINKGFARLGSRYNMSIEEVKSYFKRREDMMPLLNELLNEKILNYLLTVVTVKEVEAKSDDATVSTGADESKETGDKA